MRAAHLEFGGEVVALLAERAVWWERERTLFIADLHLGKTAAFRASGVAAPEAVTRADLARLGDIVTMFHVEHLVVLGDLVHARAGCTPVVMEELRCWRARHAQLHVSLVSGNHDRAAGYSGDDLRIARAQHAQCFDLIHDPADAQGERHCLAGHLHPGVTIRGAGKGSGVRARCFWLRGGRVLVLPAFGGFTGSMAVRARPGDRVFAVGPGAVLEVTAVCVPDGACR